MTRPQVSPTFSTFASAESERARRYRAGMLSRCELHPDGWRVVAVTDPEAEAICRGRADARRAVRLAA